MNSIPARIGLSRSCLLLLGTWLATSGLLFGQLPGPPPWLDKSLPAGHPARVKTWNLAWQITWHVKGDENRDRDGRHQKLDFGTDVQLTGEVTLQGPALAGPPPGTPAPKNAAEAMKMWQAYARRIEWQSRAEKVPRNQARVPLAGHLRDVDFRVNSWSWLRTHTDPGGGEDTTWTDTDFERKVSGVGQARLTVVGMLIFDMDAGTYDLQLSITDNEREQPLTVKSRRVVESGDHNGTYPPENEATNGKLPLGKAYLHTCESPSWHGYCVELKGRTMPEGAPESFVIDLTEPMTRMSPELCPIVLEQPAAWLARHPRDATVTVHCTVSRKE